MPTHAEQLAAFVVRTRYDDISEAARLQLKIRILDSLACAIGALEGQPIQMIRRQIEDFGAAERCTLIGGGRTSPDQAALYNSALVRYLDFNDSYLAKGETCHPSDNLGALLAAADYANAGGQDLLTALAVAYQVQCRLSDVAPVRDKGFDHTVQGSYALAAGISRALRLDALHTASALAICGTAFNALRVTRTGALSNWKGLAYPMNAFACTYATFLAMRGVTGPLEVFEGNKGFMESIAGPFAIDWQQENLEKVTQTIIKRFNAEIHSQAVLEAVLALQQEHDFKAEEVSHIDIDIFDVAHRIIGGGEEGDKTIVHSKEQADHSLPYMVAVAILDGQVTPAQYLPERISRPDVQTLLRKVLIRPLPAFSQRFPSEMPCHITVTLANGLELQKTSADYLGFHTRPMTWQAVADKFRWLSRPYTDQGVQQEIIDCVRNLDTLPVRDLMGLLSRVRSPHLPAAVS